MTHQVALITGGASGIGLETARKLIGQGVTVVISGRRQEAGDAAVKELQSIARDGAQARFIRNDVTDEAAAEAMIDQIVSEFGRLDMAVNNAGISNETATIEGSDSDNFRAMIDTNILGLYFDMKYEIRQMLKQGKAPL